MKITVYPVSISLIKSTAFLIMAAAFYLLAGSLTSCADGLAVTYQGDHGTYIKQPDGSFTFIPTPILPPTK